MTEKNIPCRSAKSHRASFLVRYEVCVWVRVCVCAVNVRLCGSISVNVIVQERCCAIVRSHVCVCVCMCVSVCAFLHISERDLRCVCRMWPAVIYSDSLPLRMPPGQCVHVCVRVCVSCQPCGYVNITQTWKYTTIYHLKHLSVSI